MNCLKFPKRKKSDDYEELKDYEDIREYRQEGVIYYDEYDMPKKEKAKYFSIAALALFALGYIFYRSLILSLILAAGGIFAPKYMKKEIIKKRKKQLSYQFKEGLYSLSAALGAGRSIESAFEEAVKDLMILYQDEETFVIKEFDLIVKKIKMNQTVEDAVMDFANRSENEDVENFADVFVTCKRTGGDLISIIKNTSDSISDKIQIEQEIETLISEKKMEQKVLNIMPLGLIAFLSLSSGDFMEPVFTTFIGRVVMTIALALFGLSYMLSQKIMNIEV